MDPYTVTLAATVHERLVSGALAGVGPLSLHAFPPRIDAELAARITLAEVEHTAARQALHRPVTAAWLAMLRADLQHLLRAADGHSS